MTRLSIFVIFFVILVIVAISSGQNSYCNICPNHTLCKANYKKPVCSTKQYGLTQQQRNAIVNTHNNYRQKVASGNEKRGSNGPQPPAKYMPNLEWDNELAAIAQAQANSCHYGHDSCRNVKRFSVGQNIAQWPTAPGWQPATVESLIKLWYEEVKLFNRNYIEHFKFEMATGHYTQMLWAKTTKIGCGYVNYLNGKLYTVYLVCNYGPSGNYKNAQMYEIRK